MTTGQAEFERYRAHLTGVAYRMLGTVADAEDAVQEAYLRFAGRDMSDVVDPQAWLTSTVARICLDVLKSARVQRERYVGPWLPEPLLTDHGAGPADAAETAESLSMAFLVVLETLSPVERAVFLLHDVFGYDYAEVATVVDKSEANCRQLATRARRHVQEGRPRFDASAAARAELASRFWAAATAGDMDGLVSLLAGDAAFYGDGGEKGSGLRAPVVGRDNVARVVLGLSRRAGALGITMRPVEINGDPGAMFFDADGGLISLISLEIADGQAHTVRGFVNPDKIAHLGRLSPLGRRATSGDWA
jgi:RNA polymerase sigma-70 factor, ECF subfamily